jgi:hypothetical protein
MTDRDEREQAGAESEKDVEGHGFTPPARAPEGETETEEPDVEGHGFTPPAQYEG